MNGRRLPAAPPRRQRGVALLLAILVIALLSAVLTDFLYRSRVDLSAAGNYRDREQARFAARAGVEAAQLFITALKPNEWADALLTLGIPGFGTGGFIYGKEDALASQRQVELEGQVFNSESDLTGISFATDYFDMPRDDPEGFNNGYLLFVAGLTGFNLFDDGDETTTEDDDIDVQIRFIDESSRFNLNALYYCPASSGCKAENEYNRLLFYQIRQLFIEELIRKREYAESHFTLREKDREAAAELTDRDMNTEEIDIGDIDEIMCAILDWLDPDDIQSNNEGCISGAEKDYYTGLDAPYETRNGPFESVGELRLVSGVTPEVYRAVAPYLTVYPRVEGQDCSQRLETITLSVPEDAKPFLCFDDRVNLHAASDAVIRAWAVGGFNRSDQTEPDLRNRDIKEFKEEILTLLNCARTPEDRRERVGCPPPAPSSEPASDCWANAGDVKKALEQSGIYAVQEVAATPNVGAAGRQPLSCAGGAAKNGPGGAQPGGGGGALAAPQIDFRRLVGDYITIEALGQVGLTRDVVMSDDEPEDENADPLPRPVEARITATYHVDSEKTPVTLQLLRWIED